MEEFSVDFEAESAGVEDIPGRDLAGSDVGGAGFPPYVRQVLA